MQARATGGKHIIFCSLIALSTLAFCTAADASTSHHHARSGHLASASRYARHFRYARAFGISCVPYAREESGIDVPGNAWEWWDNAAGTYARGQVPQAGAVLTFRANARMRLGHVAVVQRVVNSREIEVNQANWGSGGRVSHDVPVVDVSEENDWTAVRVGLGDSSDFGAVYPTYGFIYDRADTGVMLASATRPTPAPALNPAPRDLRDTADLDDEVAEAPGATISYAVYHPHLRHTLHVAAHTHRIASHHAVRRHTG
jgi:surface antigen